MEIVTVAFNGYDYTWIIFIFNFRIASVFNLFDNLAIGRYYGRSATFNGVTPFITRIIFVPCIGLMMIVVKVSVYFEPSTCFLVFLRFV